MRIVCNGLLSTVRDVCQHAGSLMQMGFARGLTPRFSLSPMAKCMASALLRLASPLASSWAITEPQRPWHVHQMNRCPWILRREHEGLPPHCNVIAQRDLSTLKNQSIERTDLGSLGDAFACAAPHRITSRGSRKALIFRLSRRAEDQHGCRD